MRQKEVLISVKENAPVVKVELPKSAPGEPVKTVSIKPQRIDKVLSPPGYDIRKPVSVSHLEKPAVNVKKHQLVKPYLAKETNRLESDHPEPVTLKPELRAVSVIETVPQQATTTLVEAPRERSLSVTRKIEEDMSFDPRFSEPQEQITTIETVAEVDGAHQDEPQEVTKSRIEQHKFLAVEQIVETTAVSSETAEQATTLLVVLPEQVQTSLKEYISEAEPTAVEKIEARIVMISRVADRLHELVESNEGQGEEAEQIVLWLTEQYTELLNTLGIECDEESVAAFIELIKSDDYVVNADHSRTQEPYDPMRERHGWSDLRGRQTATNLTKIIQDELARFTVHHGLAA